MNFVRFGLTAKEFEQDPRKRSTVTGTPNEPMRERVDHKYEKQSFLTTQNPDMFGTTVKFYPQQRNPIIWLRNVFPIGLNKNSYDTAWVYYLN